MKTRFLLCRCFVLTVLTCVSTSLHAQWLTQTFNLKQGWNAVYLHVEVPYTDLTTLLGGSPIEEVWLWKRNQSADQFVQSPAAPVESVQWASWKSTAAGSSALQYLGANEAYLVYSAAAFTWNVKGRPRPPRYEWTTSGLNFLGLPTPAANPPVFSAWLGGAPNLQQSEIILYQGGEALGTGPANLITLYAPNTTPVTRGRAWWIKAVGIYNKYYGPFELVTADNVGAEFGAQRSAYRLRLRNLTPASLEVTVQLLASEDEPAGQANIVATPPLLMRGDLNLTNLTYGYSALPENGDHTWTLPPAGQNGSETEVVIGLNRAAISASEGDLLAGVLRFTDSRGHTQVDVPVSATVASDAGLWVGGAAVTQVRQYLKSYVRDDQGEVVTSDVNSQVLDQSQVAVDAAGSHAVIDQNSMAAQIFVSGHNAPLTRVGLQLDKVTSGASPPDLIVKIQGVDTNGAPSGSALSSIQVPADSIAERTDNFGQLLFFDFHDPPALVRGGSYVLVLELADARSDVAYRWHQADPAGEDAYPSGEAYQEFAGAWSSLPADFVFQTYMGSPDVAFGQSLVSDVNTEMGGVQRAFPLRLIVHNPDAGGSGNAVLLQRVYAGLDLGTNFMLSASETGLNPAFLDQAHRISATHLPWSEANAGWTFNGLLGRAAQITATVELDHRDQAANPFLHTYHPDHDNLNATRDTELEQGRESYTIRREITLSVAPPADDFASIASAGETLSGDYLETITFLGLARESGVDQRRFEVRGAFSLNRISDHPVLTGAP